MAPIPKVTTTRASQPNVAVFQWSALQRPMRAARLRGRLMISVLADIWFLLSVGRLSGGVGERVVEGVEGAVRGDREAKAIAAAALDRHGHGVLARMPEQPHRDAVVFASSELAGRCCGGHGSSFGFGHDDLAAGHGICTSVTLVAVVRSAT